MLKLHELLAWVIIIANGSAGAWSLAAHWFDPFRQKQLWWAVGCAQSLAFVQVFIGVFMVAVQGVDVPQFHMFYGFVMLISVGILFAYRNEIRAQLYLLYGCGGLFIMGLGIRALLLA